MTVSLKKILSASVAGALALALAACTPSLPGGTDSPENPNGPGVSGPSIETSGSGGSNGQGGGQGGPSAPNPSTSHGQIALTAETFYSGIYNDLSDETYAAFENLGEPATEAELMQVLAQFELAFPQHLRDLVDSNGVSAEIRMSFWTLQMMMSVFGQLTLTVAGVDKVEYTVDQSMIEISGNTAVVPGEAFSSNLGSFHVEMEDVNLVFVDGRWKISPLGF